MGGAHGSKAAGGVQRPNLLQSLPRPEAVSPSSPSTGQRLSKTNVSAPVLPRRGPARRSQPEVGREVGLPPHAKTNTREHCHQIKPVPQRRVRSCVPPSAPHNLLSAQGWGRGRSSLRCTRAGEGHLRKHTGSGHTGVLHLSASVSLWWQTPSPGHQAVVSPAMPTAARRGGECRQGRGCSQPSWSWPSWRGTTGSCPSSLPT